MDLDQTLHAAVQTADRLLLLLDFDGTLAPIADDPARVQLPLCASRVLQALDAQPAVTLAVLSGRKLDDVKARIGLPILYAGNHGLEYEGPDFRFLAIGADHALHQLARIRIELERTVAKIPGVLIENKGYGLGVHYRRVAEARVPEVRRLVQEACVSAHGAVRVKQAKKLLEVQTVTPHNKGVAALWIRDHVDPRAAIVAAGDDLTDEDMFRVLPGAITIKIGPGETIAHYRLADSDEFCAFLERTLETVRHKARTIKPGCLLEP